MKTVIPGLTPDEVRRLRFPRKRTVVSQPSPERQARLDEIARLITAGYSRRESIKLELKEEIADRVIRRDLQDLKKRGAIKCVRRTYWIPK